MNESFIHGNLEQSQAQAARDVERFRSSVEWAPKFRVLEAKIALWRGLYPDVLNILGPDSAEGEPETVISELSVLGVGNAYIQNFQEAERLLARADELCKAQPAATCGDLLQSRGLLASQEKNTEQAVHLYEQALQFARAHHDAFLESCALLNLGDEFLSRDHFDEAVDLSESSRRVAALVNAHVVEQSASANIGWARYRLGDSEGALAIFLDAERLAVEHGVLSDQENDLTNIGYVYMDEQRFSEAKQSFLQALDLARSIRSKEDVYHATRVLARVSLELGETDKAEVFAEQALGMARDIASNEDELYPRLVQGLVAAKRRDFVKAEETLQLVERDPACPVSLKWQTEHARARLYEEQEQPARADREYQLALRTFEEARSMVRRADLQISFLSNGAGVYDDYVHFLVHHRRSADALDWADFSRARTVVEELRGEDNQRRSARFHPAIRPARVNAQRIALRKKGSIFSYWLGERESYLWVATPSATRMFVLPSRSNIEGMVKRYRAAVTGPQDVLDAQNEDGVSLYKTLVEPARKLLPVNSRIFIIPDGGLNNLNFETLLVPSAKLHYWIEDADVLISRSLHTLATAPAGNVVMRRKLMLIGNSIAVNRDYPELPNAAAQMGSVSKYFSRTEQTIFQREEATPEAYLNGNPETFSNIHFVAHGTGSRLSPLESAIVLSEEKDGSNNFKLYARDVVHHRLRAELVTISACYSAGERQYSGEGLVGLAWAFLQAGSHNVIAALWDVEDASTDLLMNHVYAELAKGAEPDVALRAAKISLLKTSDFRSPFYWGPFQIYRG